MQKSTTRTSHRWRNVTAACVTILSVGILHGSFDALPAGEDVAVSDTRPLRSFAEEADVPIPPGSITAANVKADPLRSSDEVQAADGVVFDSKDALTFCTLMLRDGARFMEGLDDYTVIFNKEERIDGDLQEPQSIEMKVQHTPHFAVYMKWKTGPRGQQLLYSDEYEDGNLVFKFGGIKRFLPGIKLDPCCAAARAESRYPCTEAGVLGMIRQIIKHRERDLKLKSGVKCVRLPDLDYDQRTCFSFLITYENRKACEKYRKSLIHLDADLHIPLMVRNFTWATDAEYDSEAELDKATLIENYSFQGLNLSSELVAQDFSRKNPKYRM